MSGLNNLLAKHILEEEPQFKLVCIDENQTVAEALEILKDSKIISLPVRNAKNTLVGMLDVLDLITLCVTKFSKVSIMAYDSWQQMEEFAEKKVKDLLNISGRNNWCSVDYKAPLVTLTSFLSKPNFHRIVVLNEVKDVVGIISQSKLVEVLYNKRESLSDKLKITAKELARSPVESIDMNKFVIDAFRKIWDQQVTGIAVVDEQGKLVGNISASDLTRTHYKPIGPIIHDLYQPIKYFNYIRTSSKDKILMAEMPRYPPITVQPNDTLEAVMKTIVENKIHRVYLVDDNSKPVGVISLGDIIAALFGKQSE
jgi:CBS domain-containing protein